MTNSYYDQTAYLGLLAFVLVVGGLQKGPDLNNSYFSGAIHSAPVFFKSPALELRRLKFRPAPLERHIYNDFRTDVPGYDVTGPSFG